MYTEIVTPELETLLKSQDKDSKSKIVDLIRNQIKSFGFNIVEEDIEKPWGAYFRISDDQKELFFETFFNSINLPDLVEDATVSPKILLVAPAKRLSWQKHERRGEFWRVVFGPVGILLSDTDEQPDSLNVYNEGETVNMPANTRHRLVGLDRWGVIAEIWLHSDPDDLSDEKDIVRIDDDFGR